MTCILKFPFADIPSDLHSVILENASISTAASMGLTCKNLWRSIRQRGVSWRDFKLAICKDGEYELYIWARENLSMTFDTRCVAIAARYGHRQIVLDSLEFEAKLAPMDIFKEAVLGGHFQLVQAIRQKCHLPPHAEISEMIAASDLSALKAYLDECARSSENSSPPWLDCRVAFRCANLETVQWVYQYESPLTFIAQLLSSFPCLDNHVLSAVIRLSHNESSKLFFFFRYLVRKGLKLHRSMAQEAAVNPHADVLPWVLTHCNDAWNILTLEAAIEFDRFENFLFLVLELDPELSERSHYLNLAYRHGAFRILDYLSKASRPRIIPHDVLYGLHKLDRPRQLANVNALLDRGIRLKQADVFSIADLALMNRLVALQYEFDNDTLYHASLRPWDSEYESIIRFLLEKGCQPDERLFYGCVRSNCRRSFLEFLVKSGCPTGKLNYLHLCPADSAAEPFDRKERYLTLRSLNVPHEDVIALFRSYLAENDLQMCDIILEDAHPVLPWDDPKFFREVTEVSQERPLDATKDVLDYLLRLCNQCLPLSFFVASIDQIQDESDDWIDDLDDLRDMEACLGYLFTISPDNILRTPDFWTSLCECIRLSLPRFQGPSTSTKRRIEFLLTWFHAVRPVPMDEIDKLVGLFPEDPDRPMLGWIRRFFMQLKEDTNE